jgi:protein SCO1/2
MSRTTFSFKKICILLVILALPGYLYYLLKEKGKNRYHPLEIYGPKKLSGTFHLHRGKQIPDTAYHHISLFPLSALNGASTYLAKDTFSVKVVCFYFEGSAGEKRTNAAMDRVAAEYRNNPRIRFYSVTGTREGKAAGEALSAYYKAESKKWQFLTGSVQLVQQIARHDFLVDAISDTTGKKQFVVSPMLILLDPSSRIRGFYDSGSAEQVSKLSDEIKVLIAEELRKIKGAF